MGYIGIMEKEDGNYNYVEVAFGSRVEVRELSGRVSVYAQDA